MEVILQDVKPDPKTIPDLGESGGQRLSSKYNSNNSNSNHTRNFNLSGHKISTIQSVSGANLISSPTPVRFATLSGQQLQTMAKSSGLSVVHVTVPQTVIQSPSVIQSAAGQLQLSKGNVILVSSKQNSSVIQTTGGAIQTVQVLEANHSDESLSNDGIDHPHNVRTADRRRREILTRRPSYRKILNDLGGAEISADKGGSGSTSESDQEGDGGIVLQGHYPPGVVKVINANALGLGQVTTAEGTGVPAAALQTITMTNAGTAGGTIVQYAQSQDGQQFFVPVGSEIQAYTIRPVSSASSSPSVVVGGLGGHTGEGEQGRKREIRLLKNREAARECRRKKKEYIKCLENRVAVLENQNKALIDELKSLKELYCQQKND